MLTISREVPVKIGKHGWNVYPLEAFGYLLGKPDEDTVYAALPCSKTQNWDKFDDRWIVLTEPVAKAFGLEVMGYYATTESISKEDCPSPPSIVSLKAECLILYHTCCCPRHSWLSYQYRGRWLQQGESYKVSGGVRLNPVINQKRILTAWSKAYGLVDDSNPSATFTPR